MAMKARLIVNGKMCKPGLDYNPDETYCGNVVATSIKVFFALSALYGLILREGDLVGAYLVTPGSKDFMLCMATPDGVALHSLYLRTVRSRTLQVRLLFSTTHYYSVTDLVNVATFTHCIACLFTAVTYNKI